MTEKDNGRYYRLIKATEEDPRVDRFLAIRVVTVALVPVAFWFCYFWNPIGLTGKTQDLNRLRKSRPGFEREQEPTCVVSTWHSLLLQSRLASSLLSCSASTSSIWA